MLKSSFYTSTSEDIIQEERESILRESNTAQTQLENIIQKLKPEIVDLNLQGSFSGELDLTILGTKFPRLKTLIFGQGKITDIRNIPSGVSKFVCNHNLLMSLERLPGSLIYLDIDHNFLKTLDLSKTPYLEELHCCDNRLENILDFPSSLTRLYCDQNRLQQLNLLGLSHLKVLHVSDNPLLVLENIPQDIHDYVAENNPLAKETTSYDYAEWEYEEDIRQAADWADKKEVKDRKIKYLDALTIYFKIKNEYENDLLKKRRIAYKKALSKKAGVLRAKKIKGQCYHCHRMVGMEFRSTVEGYVARCGDTHHPCQFIIKLFRGNFSSNEYFLYLFREQLEKEKIEIIRQKLDSLFSYISEESSVKEFKKILDSYNDSNVLYSELLKRNNEINHNEHTKELLQKKQAKVYQFMSKIQSMVQEYKSSPHSQDTQHINYGGATGILRTAMELYVKDLLPEVENLRRLKYEIMEMDNNRLFQRETGLQKLEYTYGDAPTVEKFRNV